MTVSKRIADLDDEITRLQTLRGELVKEPTEAKADEVLRQITEGNLYIARDTSRHCRHPSL
jgi:hypothetical protein